jgi:FKBP-type peptidyl-prolyl cis-trans isomerase 2
MWAGMTYWTTSSKLEDHQVGDLIDLHLEPEEAFGDFDELLVFLEPRALFPAQIEEGMTIEGHALLRVAAVKRQKTSFTPSPIFTRNTW